MSIHWGLFSAGSHVQAEIEALVNGIRAPGSMMLKGTLSLICADLLQPQHAIPRYFRGSGALAPKRCLAGPHKLCQRR